MRSNDGIIHPQLSKVISEFGHLDSLVIADAGLPIPLTVERVDLAYRPGSPAFLDVLDLVLAEFVVERAVIAAEAVEVSPEFASAVTERLLAAGVEVEHVAHVELKALTHSARAIVRTGEYTPLSNVILYAGAPF